MNIENKKLFNVLDSVNEEGNASLKEKLIETLEKLAEIEQRILKFRFGIEK